MATEKDNGMDKVISPEVFAAIKDLQLALLKRAKSSIDDDDEVDSGITNEQLIAMLISVLSGQTTAQQNAQLMSALSGQTSGQQGSQQATQQAAEIIAALTGRTQTETSHKEDVNTPERIAAAVARGVDNNELASQRYNNIAGNVAEMASVGLSVLLTSTPVVAAQIQAQVADIGMKNSDNGRLVQDCVKAGHGDCKPCKD
jgi:hypothetical protein